MKKVVKLYAKYNRDVDNKIIELLSRLSEYELNLDRNMYYKNINKLFNHITMAGWYYQNAIRYITGREYPNDKERNEIFRRLEVSFSEASKILKELDEGLIELIDDLSDEEFVLERKNMKLYNGRVIDISVWEYITQHITHQTHHRGQLSQVLDELGIEHDLGNIFPYVRDSIS